MPEKIKHLILAATKQTQLMQPEPGAPIPGAENKADSTADEQNKTIPETTDMEVHHHPHVEKKSFKEYLLEGLMIFLAVSMGFIAENIREYISDNAKEREYIVNIKKDLIDDTVSINVWQPSIVARINAFDSLIAILKAPLNTPHGSDLYYYARLTTRIRGFDASNGTITELKNSGNFRLLRNEKVVKGITRFEKVVESYGPLSALEIREAELLYPLLGTLFDATVFDNMVKQAPIEHLRNADSILAVLNFGLQRPAGNPQLIKADAEKINQLIFYVHQRKSSFMGEIRLLAEQKKSAIQLIQLINEEYNLDDE